MKRSAIRLDFVLWKRAKPGEPYWPSPWGEGRPGWHIECSAMSLDLLGSHFDIHGGGMDLKFPHHENEIAQSCAATGDRFANLWMHNGFVNVDNEKMSKSLGNFFRIRDVLDSGHGARSGGAAFLPRVEPLPRPDQLFTGADRAGRCGADASLHGFARRRARASGYERGEATQRFEAAMDDDFNTPDAIAALQTLATEINRAKAADDRRAVESLAAELRQLGAVLGVLQSTGGGVPAQGQGRSRDRSGARGRSATTDDQALLNDHAIERTDSGTQGRAHGAQLQGSRPDPRRAGGRGRDSGRQTGRNDHLAPRIAARAASVAEAVGIRRASN